MGLISPKSNDLSFYIRGVRTETSHIILTVHDEIDYIADNSILKPLTKKLSQFLDISSYYKRFKVPYIRYLFDVEYDEFGAWTAGKAIDVYKEPLNKEEHTAIKAYKEALAILKGSVAESKEESSETLDKIKVDFINVDIKTEEFVSELEKLPEGNTILRVKISDKKSLKFYKKLEQNALLDLINRLDLKVC